MIERGRNKEKEMLCESSGLGPLCSPEKRPIEKITRSLQSQPYLEETLFILKRHEHRRHGGGQERGGGGHY